MNILVKDVLGTKLLLDIPESGADPGGGGPGARAPP